MRQLLFVFFLVLIVPQTASAYIDPGTGSMLFSIVLCSITTLYFLFRAIFIKLRRVLFLKNTLSSGRYQFVVYSEGNQYYAVFKPVLDEFESRKIPVMYYSSASDDFLFKEQHTYVKKEFIGKGNKAYFKLAFLNADVCLMTTPQLDVLQLKRSKNVKHYAHILHSIAFSYSYKLFSLDYYDSVLCDAEYQIPMIREIEHKRKLPPKKLPVVGSTYMDFNKKRLQNTEKTKKTDKYTILLAPTWGKDSLLNKYGQMLIDQFISTDYNVIIRPHPQTLLIDKNLVNGLVKKYNKYPNISWDFSNNNLDSMSISDILLTDWSGIMADYALLFKKTFLYTGANIHNKMFDSYELDEPEKWKYKMLSKIGKKLEEDDIKNIIKIIEDIKNDLNFKNNIDEVSTYFWAHKGESAKNVVNFLVDVQKSFHK